MKYTTFNWNLEISNGIYDNDDAMSVIAKEIENGNNSGTFEIDTTNYNKIDTLKQELENKLGRTVDFTYRDSGELKELLGIAKFIKDNEIEDIINELLEEYE